MLLAKYFAPDRYTALSLIDRKGKRFAKLFPGKQYHEPFAKLLVPLSCFILCNKSRIMNQMDRSGNKWYSCMCLAKEILCCRPNASGTECCDAFKFKSTALFSFIIPRWKTYSMSHRKITKRLLSTIEVTAYSLLLFIRLCNIKLDVDKLQFLSTSLRYALLSIYSHAYNTKKNKTLEK